MESNDIKQLFYNKRCEIYLKKKDKTIIGTITEVKRWSIVVNDQKDESKGLELIDIDQIARIKVLKGE